MKPVSRGIDRIEVTFDDEHLVANAELLLVSTLAARLGIEELVNATVGLVGRVGGALPGRKVLTLVHAIVAGGSHIDHADVLRAGATQAVLGHRVMAPSTLGTFLRAFTFGHVRQLEAVVGKVLERAWAQGAGPGQGRLVVGVDSTICEVAGPDKAGAAFGYTRALGYHPLVAARAETGEVLHARMRKGSANTARGAKRFVEELIARVRRAGAAGEIVLRFDSGFWSHKSIEVLGRLDVRYTMAVRANNSAVARAIAAIDESDWTDIDYTPDGEAQVAECTYRGRRLIVRRTRLSEVAQARLWPHWRHFGFLTDLDGDAVALDAFHRHHAVVELAIRDSRREPGSSTSPLGTSSPTAPGCACGAGSQPHPLDHQARQPSSAAGAGRGSQRSQAFHRHARVPRQPLRHPYPARPS
ncbi:MAG TPA: IS1380 family transposase [Acidimicrobiales bacterium]|nr:IS1380 family transposase [Acidimicrobiales bacterium]